MNKDMESMGSQIENAIFLSYKVISFYTSVPSVILQYLLHLSGISKMANQF